MPRRTALRPDEYAALLGSTIVHISRLEALGLARSTVAQRCRAGGPWQRLLPGIVMLSNGPPTRADRRRAALLYAGAGSVLTGADALELHGMERMPRPSGPVHVLIPADRRRAGSGRVLAERTGRLPVPAPGRWPLAPVVRATLDFTRRCTDRKLRGNYAHAALRPRPPVLAIPADSGNGRHVRPLLVPASAVRSGS